MTDGDTADFSLSYCMINEGTDQGDDGLLNDLKITFIVTLDVGLLSAHDDTDLSPVFAFIGWKKTAGAVGVAWDKIQSDGILPDYDRLNLTWVLSDCNKAQDAGFIIEWQRWGVDVVLGPPCPSLIVTCMEDLEAKRQLMISIAEEGMATKEYMWLLIQIQRNGFGELWKDTSETPDGKDDLALQAARNFFVQIDRTPLNSSTQFVADIKAKMLQPPYNCTDCDDIDPATSQVSELADSMLLYATALNRSIAAGLPNPTGYELVHFAKGSFQGFSGSVTINANLTRDPEFLVYGLDSNDQQIVLMTTTEDLTNISTSLIHDMYPASVIWAHHGGSPPLNRPLCDYDGSACPPSFAEKYLTITLIAIIVPIAIAIVAFALLLREEHTFFNVTTGDFNAKIGPRRSSEERHIETHGLERNEQAERLSEFDMNTANNREHCLEFAFTAKYGHNQYQDDDRVEKGYASPPVLLLGRGIGGRKDTHCETGTDQRRLFQRTIATLCVVQEKIRLPKKNCRLDEFVRLHNCNEEAQCTVQMKSTEHDNLCKFIGLSTDGPQLLSVWKYCSRGSLKVRIEVICECTRSSSDIINRLSKKCIFKDVIEKGAIQMDWFFKYSLIRDISEAIYFLHHSSFGAHGWLSSKTCLIDERWKVIIFPQMPQDQTGYRIIPLPIGSDFFLTKCDSTFSFAIICSEVITKKSAWDLQNQDYDIDGNFPHSEFIINISELVYKLKRGGRSPIRPVLNIDDYQNPSMLVLVKDCWSEEPDQRPSCDQVKSFIKGLNDKKKVFLLFIFYHIQARMRELAEEKKKSDILLYRMLPKQVADKLKLGQSVEPEVFDCATLFFSDVKIFYHCQVIGFLNDLYTLFDAIIEQHDVYKVGTFCASSYNYLWCRATKIMTEIRFLQVETIGDGYLCASGLPQRNGNEHGKEIAEMSFELLRAIKEFRIPHLPNERVNVRIGIHTGYPSPNMISLYKCTIVLGSVVTGVVGITMPRYCLFGDTVNTASRMESNGKPGRIHISTDTMRFLTQVVGGYKTEPRGEVIVKGKGAVETHWLLTPEEQEQSKN
ncbi:unnamed protein product [Angiostrongylus costaricensis]|uniref:guanylate cyclase n=1 Tax=Angiostrongylus costaricensis TaxID=334426 RepID=A0A158PH52_ANGCS|nr:unnamed protein product [Angiostrongylus costaricensis]